MAGAAPRAFCLRFDSRGGHLYQIVATPTQVRHRSAVPRNHTGGKLSLHRSHVVSRYITWLARLRRPYVQGSIPAAVIYFKSSPPPLKCDTEAQRQETTQAQPRLPWQINGKRKPCPGQENSRYRADGWSLAMSVRLAMQSCT